MTWARNISRIAARAPSGASTPIRGTTLSATTCGTPSAGSRRPRHGRRRCRRPRPGRSSRRRPGRAHRRRATAALPPSVPPVSSTTSGAVCPRRALERTLGHTRRRESDHRDDLAAARQRDPAAGLGGDQLLVADTAIRSPPPALEHASTSASAARASCATRASRQAAYPSRTSRSPASVVGWLGGGDDPALGEVDQRRLGERGAEVDAEAVSPSRRRSRHRSGHWSRSASRSSAVSMPTLSRTRSAGTSRSVPATLAWVIRPGCSISDSTPPSDSPRVKTRVRSQTRERLLDSPPATRNDTMPPNRFICRPPPRGRGARAGRGRSPR